MKLVELECKNCGGNLKVEEGTDIVTCPYCNATYKIDDEVKHVKYDDMENSGYEFEKGRIKAQKEHLYSATSTPIPTKFIVIPIFAIVAFFMIASIIGFATRNKTENSVEVSKNEFNLNYNNGRQYGGFVEDDLADIIESNKKYSKKIVVKYEDKETDDPAEIANIKKNLDLSKSYEITLDYDKDGYLCCYTIEKAEKTAQEIESEKTSFNLYYRAGSLDGFLIGHQLDKVIENNKTNEERKITVKYNDIETNDPDEIIKIKDLLGDFTTYEVIFDYDSNGFITMFKIEDK